MEIKELLAINNRMTSCNGCTEFQKFECYVKAKELKIEVPEKCPKKVYEIVQNELYNTLMELKVTFPFIFPKVARWVL